MRLSQLKYALEIMKVKSLSKASENLFITKTALSEAIISLEKELGFEIFMRSRAGMEPTTEGHIFLQGAEKILQIADSWENLKMIKSMKKDIKLAVSYAIFPILNDLMEEFITGKSGVSLEMQEYGAGEVLSVLSKDKNMIAILSVSETISWPEFKKFEKNNPQWKIEELGNDEFVLAIHKNHPIVKKK